MSNGSTIKRKQTAPKMKWKFYTKYAPSHYLISLRQSLFRLEGNHARICHGHGKNNEADLFHFRSNFGAGGYNSLPARQRATETTRFQPAPWNHLPAQTASGAFSRMRDILRQ
jgi:hypothetical protein